MTVKQSEELEVIVKAIRQRFPNMLPEVGDCPVFEAPEARFFRGKAATKLQPGALAAFPLDQLVEEVTVLLNRCLASRDAKLDLEAKALDFALDVELAERQESIRRDQIAAGEFTLPADLARIESSSHGTALLAIGDVAKHRRDAVEYRSTGNVVLNQRMLFAGDVAAYSAYQTTDEAKKAAINLTKNAVQYEQLSALSDEASNQTVSAVHEGLKQSAETRFQFESKNTVYRQSLFEAEVDTRKKRVKLATTTNVGLNYKERFLEIQRLFEADLASAYVRLQAVQLGIKQLFGIDRPLPQFDTTRLTDMVLWMRERIDELGSSSDRELKATITQSIRGLLGEQNWKAGLATGLFQFRIDVAAFPGVRCVRIRGIRAYLETKAIGKWLVVAKMPAMATICLPDGTLSILDQSKESSVVLGNVGRRQPGVKDAECTGRGVSNRSPFGDWDLKVADNSFSNEPRADIDDLVLEFEVVAVGN